MRVAVVMGALVQEQLNVWVACSERGIDVTIIGANPTLRTDRWPSQLRQTGGARSILLPVVSPAAHRGQQLWTYRGLGRTLRCLRPDVIHVESEPWGGLTLQTLLLTRVSRLGSPICVHGADSIYWHGSRLERSIRRIVLSMALPHVSAFVSRNSAGLRLATEVGLKASTPTRVLPAVVPDPNVFQPPTDEQRRQLREQFQLPEHDVVVAYVGRLVEQKGLRDLLEAARLPEAGDPYIAIWGSGPLASLVEEALGTGGVRGRYGGPLPRSEVANALRAADVVAVPSRSKTDWREHFGRVVVEAMFSGCAVVAYASGAIPEVAGDGGVLVNEGDVDALAAAMGRLIKDEPFRVERAKLGRQQALARFDPNVVAGELIELWRELPRT